MNTAKKGRVLHVVTSLDFGGVETHMQLIGENQAHSSFEHHFCAIYKGGQAEQQLKMLGANVCLLNVRPIIPSILAVLKLIFLIREVRPDIVHTHGAEANFHGLIAARICGVPVCLAEEIGLPNHSWKARQIFKQIYRLADAVVAISQAVNNRIIELGEVSPDQTEVIFNPTRILPKRERVSPSRIFEVGFVGRLEEVKNPLALIHAAAILRSSGLNLHVIIVGDGSQREILESETFKLNLREFITFVGFDSNPFKRLENTTLYVQPSLSEGFGLALVEAMSTGLPVLATATGGVPEIITDGWNGWLLDGTDPQSIAARIAELAEMKREDLHAVGLKGRSYVSKKFSPNAYFANCDRLYSRFLSRRVSLRQKR